MGVPYPVVALFAFAFVALAITAVQLNSPRLFWTGFGILSLLAILIEMWYQQRRWTRPCSRSTTTKKESEQMGNNAGAKFVRSDRLSDTYMRNNPFTGAPAVTGNLRSRRAVPGITSEDVQ